MSKVLIFLLYFSMAFNIIQNGCNRRGNLIDTTLYHKRTLKLKNNIDKIDSLANVAGSEECFELVKLDTLFLNYSNFCFRIESYDLPNKELITVNDCVVKKETINLKTKSKSEYLRNEFIKLDSTLLVLLDETKSAIDYLDGECMKRINRCMKLKKHNGNKLLLNGIAQLLDYKSMSESQFRSDSLFVRNNLSALGSRIPLDDPNEFYKELFLALTYDIRYRLSNYQNKYLCDDAHIRWSAIEEKMILGDIDCELEHLTELSDKNYWAVSLDSQWLKKQVDLSRFCAIYPRGCMCTEASNYNPMVVQDNGTCIGCRDTMALNFCAEAVIQNDFPCRYLACNDRCYKEQPNLATKLYPAFDLNRDILVHEESLCLNYICGCMNPCAENYDPQATRPAKPDICIGSLCGCLDSTAVNYAKRLSPDWAYLKYYQDDVSRHDQSLCIYNGCTDPCSKSYDPLAKFNDNSCICDSVSYTDLEKMKVGIRLNAAGHIYSPQALRNEFNDFISKGAKKYSSVNFRKVGLDLFVDVDISEMKIASHGEHDGIPLGEYNFRPVNETIDALIGFLNFKTSNLFSSILLVKIVGEADANQIGQSGIDFRNAHRPVYDKMFKIIPPNYSTEIDSIAADKYDLMPNSKPIFLNENDKIRDNSILAFLRAFMVEQKIRDAEPSIDESRILIGAKVNAKKGKKYRRVAISMQLSGFYEIMSDQEIENLTSIADIDSAIAFFNQQGYPSSQKSYSRCPCITGVSY